MKTIVSQCNGRTNSGLYSPAIGFPELASQWPHAPALGSSGRTVFAGSRDLRTAQIQGTLAPEPEVTNAARSAPAFYICLPKSSGPEGFLLGLVAGAAFLAIAYSFFCGIQLIQHWALFSAGVEKLIQ